MDKDQSVRLEIQKTSNPSQELLKKGAFIDRNNTEWLRSVIQTCGWPKKRDVGEAAAFGAWIIAQHSDMDFAFQEQAAKAMKIAVLSGEADEKLYEKLLQRYSKNVDKKSHQTDVGSVLGDKLQITRPEISASLSD